MERLLSRMAEMGLLQASEDDDDMESSENGVVRVDSPSHDLPAAAASAAVATAVGPPKKGSAALVRSGLLGLLRGD
jgi:hypothetical protein